MMPPVITAKASADAVLAISFSISKLHNKERCVTHKMGVMWNPLTVMDAKDYSPEKITNKPFIFRSQEDFR